jgi:hypothetical protein
LRAEQKEWELRRSTAERELLKYHVGLLRGSHRSTKTALRARDAELFLGDPDSDRLPASEEETID